jgi:hypothetical protein
LENVVGKTIYNFDDLLRCLQTADYKIDEVKRREIIRKFWGDTPHKDIRTISEAIITQANIFYT